MEKKFDSTARPLNDFMTAAASGAVQLPDFQRGWVWDDEHIRSLLASISLSYPIGAVMTLQAGNPDVRFRPRPIEGVHLEGLVEPEHLLLDGQQRLTSLYQALKLDTPVRTKNARGEELVRWYYIDINKAINPIIDREEAIIGVPEDRKIRNFRGEVLLDCSSREAELAAELFPLRVLFDAAETMDWMLAYLMAGPGEATTRQDRWQRFQENVLKPFAQYQIPVIDLVKETPKEAVCQVFEKVNTGGVSLTVFELLTATYAADDFNLRDDWDARANRLRHHPVLARLASTEFLQAVTLLATYNRRQAQLARAASPAGEAIPAVSCKRREILRLDLDEYEKWAPQAALGFSRIPPFLHTEHVFAARDLPYQTQLVPLAAILAVLDERAHRHDVQQKLRQWYWCGVFGEMYGGATETRFALDLPDVVDWVEDGTEPRTVQDANFQAVRLLSLRTRNSAAYKGLYALQMRNGARDFRTGNPIDVHAYFDDAIDIHHVFPRKWCSDQGIDGKIAESIVNKTPIDARTNRRIGGNAPSVYLERLQKDNRIHPSDMDVLLSSHSIEPVALRQDDFPAFFNSRFEALLRQIEQAMGKKPNRLPNRSESPFVDPDKEQEQAAEGVRGLLEREESPTLEFKSSARWNVHTRQRDPEIEFVIAKTIAAFMNAGGGTLLIGVDDDGQVVGLENDYKFVRKGDRDGFELWLTDFLGQSLGKTPALDVRITFAEVDSKDVCRVDVPAAGQPVFATQPKGKGAKFFVRIHNSTRELVGPEILEYEKKRWH